jgi:hypothetical protein
VLAVIMMGQHAKLVLGKSVAAKARRSGSKEESNLDKRGEICIWSGKKWHCVSPRERSTRTVV